jgi:CheY-like chemotaxis protein
MATEQENQPAAPVSRQWMLVVDDDEQVRGMIANMLAASGLEVVGVAGGSAALKVLDHRATEPVLILTDVLMPGMDGLTFARKLVTLRGRSKIAIMSGHYPKEAHWPVELSTVPFLPKPCRMAELMELVDSARLEFGR